MRTSRGSSLVLLAVSAVVGLAACGGDDAGTAPTAGDLDGRSFVATSVTGADIVDGSEIVVTFEDDMVLVEAGCNSQRGGFQIDDGTLVVGAMAATQMACDEALMAQDQLMAGLMAAGPTVELNGEELTIASESLTVTLDER
jgi:heat shock protein HslJ